MRLSDVLSKSHNPTPTQVEGFLGDRRLRWGKHKRIQVGRVVRNYHCRQCNDQRSFVSGDELYALGLGERALSVDSTLRCTACDASVEVWFLLESEDEIAGAWVGEYARRSPTQQRGCKPADTEPPRDNRERAEWIVAAWRQLANRAREHNFLGWRPTGSGRREFIPQWRWSRQECRASCGR